MLHTFATRGLDQYFTKDFREANLYNFGPSVCIVAGGSASDTFATLRLVAVAL
jgi:hypothetical protein